MPPVGFEPAISAGERPQTYALDRAATGTGNLGTYKCQLFHKFCSAVKTLNDQVIRDAFVACRQNV